MTSHPNKIVHTLLWIAIITLALSSCASAASTPYASTANDARTQGFAPEAAPMVASEKSVSSTAGSGAYDAGVPQADVQRLVIKNANLSLVVLDPGQSMDAISQLAEEMGGFVVSANLYHSTLENGTEIPRASITIRIPAERLDEALQRIKSESDRDPTSETINSQDVTSEYTDLQSRLRNLQDAESQLREIMGSAVKTEDVLNVYNQLVQVREQIEVLKGQIQYYEQSAALSAISVDLIANAAVQPLTIGGWQPVGVAKDAVQALIDTMKFLVNAVIWIIIFVLPTLLVLYLILVLPLSLVWRSWRRRRAQRKAAQLQAQSPPASE